MSEKTENTPLSRLPLVLTAYSMPHTMGYLATKSGENHPQPWTPMNLMDLAQEENLTGVEFPLTSVVPSFDGAFVKVPLDEQEIVGELARRGLRFVADYGCILDHDVRHIRAYLQQAKAAGAVVVRAILSHLLCGDRRRLAGGWIAYRSALAKRLQAIVPYAEELGICIAVENHQDATTEDLIYLAERVRYSPGFGITLDTGNPLAVGEHPTEAARLLAPIIRHVHLKDYTIHFAPEGYRLVRCAAGDGVIDFPAILGFVRANGHDVLPGIEIAAQATRTVPVLEREWWRCYPPRQSVDFAAALTVLWSKGHAFDVPYGSAWEHDAGTEAVACEELDVVRRSIAYFRRIAAEQPVGTL